MTNKADVTAPSGAQRATRQVESTDISDKADIDRLRAGALGLGGIMLLSLASAAPLVGALGNIPLGIGLGNGSGMPAGYILVTVVLMLFSVGYAAMARQLTAAGGFYSFISHGIGRPAGLAAGWSALAGYLMVEVALIGAFGYFSADTVSSLLHVHSSWVVYALVGIALVGAMSYLDVKFSARVLGVALIVETIALLVMDIAVLIKGGSSGTTLGPLSPGNAFQGVAPGIGIFFAFWSFLGFEVAPNYAEESVNPKRHAALGLYFAVLIIGVVYILTSWAGVVGHGAGLTKAATSDPVNFYYSLATSYVGNWLTDVMRFFVCISALACALAFHQTTCRYFYALGREGIMPKALGRTHPKHRSPHIAVVFQTVLVAVAVLAFIAFWHMSGPAQRFSTTFAAAPYVELFGWLAIATTFWVMVNQVLSSVATVLWFRRPERREKMYWWRNLVAPGLGGIGMAAALYLLLANLTTVGGDVIFVKLIPWVCIGWFVVGLVLAFWLRSRRPDRYLDLGRLVNRSMAIAEGEEPEGAVPPAVPAQRATV